MKARGAVAVFGAGLAVGCATTSRTPAAPAPPVPALPARAASLCVRDATTPFRCPILMYHRIALPAVDENPARRHLYCPPALFSAHLDALTKDGYQLLTPRDVEQILQGSSARPSGPSC